MIKKPLTKLITFFWILESKLLYFLSRISIRNKKIWVFTGWHRNLEREIFADNAKYLFLYVANNRPDIKAVWLGRDKKITKILQNAGYKAFYIKSLPGIYYSLKAGYTIVDALMRPDNWKYSHGSRIIQLTHGKGFKKVGYDSPYSLPRYNKFLFPHLFVNYYLAVASSEYTKKMVASVYRVPSDHVLITGLPRHDIFFNKIPGADIDRDKIIKENIAEARSSGKKTTILYAPTYRPDGTNPVFENVKKGKDKNFELDLKGLDKLMAESSAQLFISLHPKFATENYDLKEFPNITILKSESDFYPDLPLFDLLITDYSSIFVDFLLLGRPIVFFVYDLEKYKKEVGLFEDFDNLSPGPKAFNNEQLLGELKQILSGSDQYKNKREEVKKIFYTFPDGNAAKRIVENIEKIN